MTQLPENLLPFEEKMKAALHVGRQTGQLLPVKIEQLWRMQDFSPHVFHIAPALMPIGASCDHAALRAAVHMLVARHESLRSRFGMVEGIPVLIVDAPTEPKIRVSRLEASRTADGRITYPLYDEFIKQPVSLCEPRQVYFEIFVDDQGFTYLACLMHHYFADAWTSQMYRGEILKLYDQIVSAEPAQLGEVTQYSEYANAQRQELIANLPSHLAFWHGRLSAAPGPAFPYDKAANTGELGRAFFIIPASILAQLRRLSSDARVSLATVCFAAFQAATANWSGGLDAVTAMYGADRMKPKFHSTAGYLIAIYPVWSRIDPEQPVREFLTAVSRSLFQTVPHWNLPPELYNHIFLPGQPFCTASFNFVPFRPAFFGGIQTREFPEGITLAPPTPTAAAFQDIYLLLVEHADALEAKFCYDTGRLSDDAALAFSAKFLRCLAKLAEDADQKMIEVVRLR